MVSLLRPLDISDHLLQVLNHYFRCNFSPTVWSYWAILT